MSKYKQKAKDNFKNRLYKEAIDNYSVALKDLPSDLDARIGILLSDLASENELEAITLFDFYESAKEKNIQSVGEIIENLLQDNSISFEVITDEINLYENTFLNAQEGIEYQDFKNLIDDRDSFKIAIEDLLFSTKIIIHKKEDFKEFVSLLMKNGYTNAALNYLESAISLYPYENFFQETLNQLEG